MRDSEFFKGIAHGPVPWGDREISVPVFYYDTMSLIVYFLAPIKKVKAILPSARMNPYRLTPWHCIVVICGFEYRDSDIGPYNEIGVNIPFILDRPSPLFMGTLRKAPEVPMQYVHHMPVTTEIARDAGVEFAGFPKFVADIRVEKQDGWVRFEANADGKHILTLAGRELSLGAFPRGRLFGITFQEGRLLRLEYVWSDCQGGISKDPSDVRLELGDHPIAQELREVQLGRALTYEYLPHLQSLLSPVCESYPA